MRSGCSRTHAHARTRATKAVGYAGNFLAGQASGWLGNELDLDCANGLDCEDEFAKMEAELDAELAS